MTGAPQLPSAPLQYVQEARVKGASCASPNAALLRVTGILVQAPVRPCFEAAPAQASTGGGADKHSTRHAKKRHATKALMHQLTTDTKQHPIMNLNHPHAIPLMHQQNIHAWARHHFLAPACHDRQDSKHHADQAYRQCTPRPWRLPQAPWCWLQATWAKSPPQMAAGR